MTPREVPVSWATLLYVLYCGGIGYALLVANIMQLARQLKRIEKRLAELERKP